MPDTELPEKKRLSADTLRQTIDPTNFDFETTADIEPLKGTIGQQRALEALDMGLEMDSCGFNIYASGPVGTGRNSTVRARTRKKANEQATPSDWCYVHNFDDPDRPTALELPAGRGQELADDMEEFIEDCRREIPRAFEREEYEKQKNEMMQSLQERRNEVLRELREKAQELEHDVRVGPTGVMAVPMVDGEHVTGEDFEELSEERKNDLREKGEQVRQMIAQKLSQLRQEQKKDKEQLEELDREVVLYAVGHLIDGVKEKYSESEEVLQYFEDVKQDIADNVELFRSPEEMQQNMPGMQQPVSELYYKYRVNVIVNNANIEGAPVVDERHPAHHNLFGQIEYKPRMGGMSTDFTLIKGGSFLEANGGYLILQAIDVLRNPFAWDSLKRAIRTREVKIENIWHKYHPTPSATLRPEPIPVELTVILVGSPFLYHLLYMLDEDFRRLFKIKADFDVEMDLTDEHLERYASFIRAQCKEDEAPPFDRQGAARIVEYGMRMAGHQKRMSTQFLYVSDLIAESAQHALRDDAERVSAEHVDEAVTGRRRRSRMVQDKLQRHIDEGVLLIDTTGEVPGQVNGLSVYDLGDYRFGLPSRITCVTSVGDAGVVNVERESQMSGNIHDKGVLTLTGFLSQQFGQDKPLSVSARLCFEQTYSGVEGDSASCAELCCLLSSLADLPLRQDIAITGSVNQRGQVQPVGGINEKIEGFFEVCQQAGLTGDQGVIIPSRNTQNLMLDRKVQDAVDDGDFHIYAVDTAREAVEILTGWPAGERQADGTFPSDTVFGKADERLREMADIMQEFGAGDSDDENKD